MSVWTQVNGNIRVDGIRMVVGKNIKKIENVLGKIVQYDDKDWKTSLPLGDEGSLEYKIIEDPDTSNMAAYSISIYGSLRNYYGEDEMMLLDAWFENVCRSLWIRQAVLQVENDNSKHYILSWNDYTNKIYKLEVK